MSFVNLDQLYNSAQAIQTTTKINDIPEVDGAQAFRWVKLDEINPEEFTFPIDKKVAKLLKTTW